MAKRAHSMAISGSVTLNFEADVVAGSVKEGLELVRKAFSGIGSKPDRRVVFYGSHVDHFEEDSVDVEQEDICIFCGKGMWRLKGDEKWVLEEEIEFSDASAWGFPHPEGNFLCPSCRKRCRGMRKYRLSRTIPRALFRLLEV